MNINPFLATDGYKPGHHKMYPQGTTLVYSNFTPRHGKHSNTDLGGVISFGQQMVIKQIHKMFDEKFFGGQLRREWQRLVEKLPEGNSAIFEYTATSRPLGTCRIT